MYRLYRRTRHNIHAPKKDKRALWNTLSIIVAVAQHYLEEYAFKHLLDEYDLLLLWINKPLSLSDVIRIPLKKSIVTMSRHGIRVVRRISGGRLSIMTTCLISTTIISRNWEQSLWFLRATLFGHQDFGRIRCKSKFTGRNLIWKLTVKVNGFSGTINGRVHHSCLLFDVKLSVMANALKVGTSSSPRC